MICSIKHRREAEQKVYMDACVSAGGGHSEEQQVLSSHCVLAETACKTTAPARRQRGKHALISKQTDLGRGEQMWASP